MFKLIRDSIFNPKNLITYRAKKGFFVVLYMLIICLFCSIPYMLNPISSSGLSNSDIYKISSAFKTSDSKIENGIFEGSTITFEINGIYISLIDSKTDIKTVKSSSVICKGDTVYLTTASYSTNNPYCFKAGTLKELSSEFETTFVFNTNANSNSSFFKGINDVYNKYKPLLVISYGLVGIIETLLNMMIFTLFSYFYLSLFFQAKRFMKKEQLFKMLLFSTTTIALGDALSYMLNLSLILSTIVLFISFIPELILEREIIKRIRMKLYGEKIINNEDVINKINDLLKNKKDDSSEDENDDENDSED